MTCACVVMKAGVRARHVFETDAPVAHKAVAELICEGTQLSEAGLLRTQVAVLDLDRGHRVTAGCVHDGAVETALVGRHQEPLVEGHRRDDLRRVRHGEE